MTKASRASEPFIGHSKAIPAASATSAMKSFPAIAINQGAYRPHYVGLVNDLKAVSSMPIKGMVAAGLQEDGAVALKKIHANAVQQGDVLTKADERLTIALMHYLERNGDAPQSTQPVINITNQVDVSPTPITMEAHIDVAPAEVAVMLPARHTVTHIERNIAGEIVSAEAIEKSI